MSAALSASASSCPPVYAFSLTTFHSSLIAAACDNITLIVLHNVPKHVEIIQCYIKCHVIGETNEGKKGRKQFSVVV